jgi:hypothetical protein
MGNKMSFDLRYTAFFEFWNRGEFLDCQEMLVGLWEESDGDEASFYEGLIRAAGAVACLERGDLGECRGLLAKALDHLDELPARFQGFNLREFVDLLATWQAKVELTAATGEIDFSPDRIPPLEIPRDVSAPFPDLNQRPFV